MKNKFNILVYWGLKIALAFAFLSACADRFGLWGEAGIPGVVWGNFENFITYTQVLLPWSPAPLTQILAWVATVLELIFGFLLLTNIKPKQVALGSGLLLLTFGLSMLFTVGIKSTLDYSVFSACFGALALHLLDLKSRQQAGS
ncbi:MAG: hypothetical protein H6620_07215 [Halobacteriovoraceae bacterium]|nr:hypothetical protein [Halobacteriovoraceae bacterium]